MSLLYESVSQGGVPGVLGVLRPLDAPHTKPWFSFKSHTIIVARDSDLGESGRATVCFS